MLIEKGFWIDLNSPNIAHEPSLGAQLQQFRLHEGFTQKELANKMGVSKSQISKIESGNQRLMLDTTVKYLSALGCQVTISGYSLNYQKKFMAIKYLEDKRAQKELVNHSSLSLLE